MRKREPPRFHHQLNTETIRTLFIFQISICFSPSSTILSAIFREGV